MKRMLMVKKVLPIVLAIILLQAISFADSQAAPPASGGSYHRVRYGETLFSIGRRYGVNPYSIASANGLSNPNYIYAGQVLRIPSGQRYSNNYNNRYNNNYNNQRYNNYNNRYYNNYNNRYYNNYNNRRYNNFNRGYRNYNNYSGNNWHGRYSNY